MADLIQTPSGFLVILLAIRLGVLLRWVPFWGGKPLTITAWLGLTGALTILLLPFAVSQGAPSVGAPFLLLALKEVFVGCLMGLLARIAFSVFEIVGELAHATSSVGPWSGFTGPEGRSGFALFYALLGIGVFVGIDGHHGLIAGIVGTLHSIPLGNLVAVAKAPRIGSDMPLVFFSAAMATAVAAAAPIFVARFAADTVLGVFSRLTSERTVSDLGVVRLIVVPATLVASLGFTVSMTLEFLRNRISELFL